MKPLVGVLRILIVFSLCSGCSAKSGGNRDSGSQFSRDSGVQPDASFSYDSGPKLPSDSGVSSGDSGMPALDAGKDDAGVVSTVSNLVFRSGFELNSLHVGGSGANCANDIRGEDLSVSPPNHWETDLEQGLGATARICFMGGNNDERMTDIVDEPGVGGSNGNKVFYMKIVAPNEVVSDSNGPKDDAEPCNDDVLMQTTYPGDPGGSRKARIQHALVNTDIAEFEYRVRMRLGEGFQNFVRSFPLKIDWMTIGEFWNVQDNGDRNRVTLNLVKEPGLGKPFVFGIKSDAQAAGTSGWSHFWKFPESRSTSDPAFVESAGEYWLVEAPRQQWFTLNVRVIAGDENSGRVKIDVIDDSGRHHPVADISGTTVYPNGIKPTFTALHTMKVYTDGNMMCWLKGEGYPLEIWWDDYQIGAK